jgi:pterin-4a-carbinolamine dehydratase
MGLLPSNGSVIAQTVGLGRRAQLTALSGWQDEQDAITKECVFAGFAQTRAIHRR